MKYPNEFAVNALLPARIGYGPYNYWGPLGLQMVLGLRSKVVLPAPPALKPQKGSTSPPPSLV